jgi:hypothetical protein
MSKRMSRLAEMIVELAKRVLPLACRKLQFGILEIGGIDSRSNDVIREILSGGIADKRNSMTMSLMVAKP